MVEKRIFSVTKGKYFINSKCFIVVYISLYREGDYCTVYYIY